VSKADSLQVVPFNSLVAGIWGWLFIVSFGAVRHGSMFELVNPRRCSTMYLGLIELVDCLEVEAETESDMKILRSWVVCRVQGL